MLLLPINFLQLYGIKLTTHDNNNEKKNRNIVIIVKDTN